MKSKRLLWFYAFLWLGFAVYSYAFLDPNLTLTSFLPYLALQKKMQWFGWFEREKSTLVFGILSLLLSITYWRLVGVDSKKSKFKPLHPVFYFLLIGVILIFAYPSFSHDIFNYIFNAKMVLVYHANPHQQVAMDFPDPMLGFMHNIHTPAPYWYVWTAISLIPGILSFWQIFPAIIFFKAFSLVQYIACFLILQKIWALMGFSSVRVKKYNFLFLFNPLILIETIAIGHNDLSMMFLAFWSFYWLLRYKQNRQLRQLFFSLGLLLVSGGIKYATLVLIPLYLLYLWKKFDIGWWGAILLFALPFIRIEQLHSWYLIWPLTWVMLSTRPKAVNFFVWLSFFALARYLPFVYYGHWDPPVMDLRLYIYLIPAILYLLVNLKKMVKAK